MAQCYFILRKQTILFGFFVPCVVRGFKTTPSKYAGTTAAKENQNKTNKIHTVLQLHQIEDIFSPLKLIEFQASHLVLCWPDQFQKDPSALQFFHLFVSFSGPSFIPRLLRSRDYLNLSLSALLLESTSWDFPGPSVIVPCSFKVFLSDERVLERQEAKKFCGCSPSREAQELPRLCHYFSRLEKGCFNSKTSVLEFTGGSWLIGTNNTKWKRFDLSMQNNAIVICVWFPQDFDLSMIWVIHIRKNWDPPVVTSSTELTQILGLIGTAEPGWKFLTTNPRSNPVLSSSFFCSFCSFVCSSADPPQLPSGQQIWTLIFLKK